MNTLKIAYDLQSSGLSAAAILDYTNYRVPEVKPANKEYQRVDLPTKSFLITLVQWGMGLNEILKLYPEYRPDDVYFAVRPYLTRFDVTYSTGN